MKYNVPFLKKDNDSASLIVDYIESGSKVLEFGCANGRMTRYLQQELGCTVCIVELEKEAFEEASLYAEKGVCGDIMEFEWLEVFQTYKFDYVIFADVLEHLYAPQLVLEKVRVLLMENGKLLLSASNIGHNDIVAKLYMDKFEYTHTGILDNTHIRFFTWNSLKDLVEEAGYTVADVKHTYHSNYQTEQFSNSDFQQIPDVFFTNLLNWRVRGCVYQYIICATIAVSNSVFEPEREEHLIGDFYGKLYFDYGDGFTEENHTAISAAYKGDGCLEANIMLMLPKGTKGLRYDPIEGQPCIILKNEILLDMGTFSLDYIEGIKGNGKTIFLNNDPQIILRWDGDIDKIHWNIIFQLMGYNYVSNIGEVLKEYSDSLTCLKFEMDQHRKEREENFRVQIEQRERMVDTLKKSLLSCEEKSSVLKSRLDVQTLENNSLKHHLEVIEAKLDSIENSLIWKMIKNFKRLLG